MARKKAERRFQKGFNPGLKLSRRLRSYYLLGSTLLGSSGVSLAQQSATGALPPGYTRYPVNLQFQEHPGGNNVNGVNQDSDVVINGKTAFKFHSYFSNVFDPSAGSSWTTFQVWVNPVKDVTATLYTKSWEGQRFSSHACNSAIIEGAPSGPGIRGHRGWDYDGTTNYLDFYRKSTTNVCVNGSCAQRTFVYSNGHYGGSESAPGAIPVIIYPGLVDAGQHFGWVDVVLQTFSTALRVVDVVIGPANGPATIQQSGCTGNGVPSSPADLGVNKDLAVKNSSGHALLVPLPDGSVPLTLGLLAQGDEGIALWRQAEARQTGVAKKNLTPADK
jgi:hypothetical protein